MAKTITFWCEDCGEMFEESIQRFLDEEAESVLAPAVCAACGHGAEDEEARP